MKQHHSFAARLLLATICSLLAACASSSIPEGECELSSDCPGTLVCRNFQCISAGTDGGLCPAGQQLVDGRCQVVACACSSDDDCPGQRCVNCMCYERLCEAGQTRDCNTECGGKQECRDGVWQPCRLSEPERCGDNVDNDCNGEVDEGCTCVDNEERPCSNACGRGFEICSNGVFSGCTAPAPRPEVCGNRIDENCDGQLDDGCECETLGETRDCATDCGSGVETCNGTTFAGCTAQVPQDEFCDGVDNDCNGVVDDNLARSCGNICGMGTETCVDGAWSGCTAPESCACTDGQEDQQVCSVPGGTSCGIKTRFCMYEVWSPWSDCTARADACEPGTVVEVPCENSCGTKSQTCTAACEWSISTCSGAGECVPNERRQSTSMDACLGTPEVCNDQCQWESESSPSSDTGACTTIGQEETSPCGNCGVRTRTCLPCFRWSDWSACGGEPTNACTPGTEERDACGPNCQTRVRTCQQNCSWSSFGECSSGGECEPNDTRAIECGLCGSKNQTCSNECIWQDDSTCGGQGVCDPNSLRGSEEIARCDDALGARGICATGYTSRTCNADTCQWNAWAACNQEPETEICGDGIDQNCDGVDYINPDEFEPNNTCASCTLLSNSNDPSGTLEARLDRRNDRDYFCFKAHDSSISYPEKIIIELTSIPDDSDYDLYLYQGKGSTEAAQRSAAVAECNAGPSQSINRKDRDGVFLEGRNPNNADERIEWSEEFLGNDSGFYIIEVRNWYGQSCTEEYTLSYDGLN